MNEFICKHRNPVRPGKPFTVDQCRICWIKSGGNVVQEVTPYRSRTELCIHLGDRVQVPGSSKDWRNCNKGHGTVCPCGKCHGCKDYENDEPDGSNHLLMHVMPVKWNNVWQRSIDQVKMRLSMFDGRKVIACVTKSAATTMELDGPDAVREYVHGTGIEVIEVENNKSLREVATWPKLWNVVEQFKNTQDRVFYCHAKGVTRPWNPGVTVHPWARLLWGGNLHSRSMVKHSLEQFPITGMFKKVGWGFGGSKSSWHYSGSFFWIRCEEAFKFDRVRRIDNYWWGNESWPGIHFPPEHAGCLFLEGRVPSLNMYAWNYATQVALPEFEKWCSKNISSHIVTG